jgi:hypothetical protein
MKLNLIAPALGIAVLLAPLASSAQSLGVPRHVNATSATGPEHRFFGSLVSANGNLLVVRLRSGRLLDVDASAAFALKHVAAPLFVGKPTVVDGTLLANGVLAATAVKRAAPDRLNWGADR